MNALAAPEIAPEVAAPSMVMLLYLAEFDDAAVLANDAASAVVAAPDQTTESLRLSAPAEADALSPTRTETRTDRSDVAPERQ